MSNRPATAPPPDPAMLLSELDELRAEVVRLRRDNQQVREELERARGGSPEAPPLLAPSPLMAAPSNGAQRAAFVAPDLGPVSDLGRNQGLDFGAIMQLTPDKLDGLPYGLITIDARGRVIYYNDTEARLVGLPKDRVIGRNFFRDVAPCTRIREFEGRFLELAANPTEVRVQNFDFIFKFARGEQHVTVVITPARVRGQFHLALLRRHRNG